MGRYPTSPLQGRILDYVRRHPRESAYQIAVQLGLQSSSVSSALILMMQAGYVTRKNGLGPCGGYGYEAVD